MAINFKPNTPKLGATEPETQDIKPQKYYFKMVAKIKDRFYSIFDGKTEYILGQTLTESVKPDHGGGFYVYRTMREAFFADVPFNKGGLYSSPRTLLICMCWGDCIEYNSGKLAWENICPIKEMPMQSGYLATKHARKNIETQIKTNDLKKANSFSNQVKSKVLGSNLPIMKTESGTRIPSSIVKKELDKKTTSELLRDQNDKMEREIKELERKLAQARS